MVTTPINFIYKFHKIPESHIARQNISIGLVENFVKKYYKDKGKSWVAEVELYPVERLGHSGASVFYMDVFNSQNDSVHHLIAKFDDDKKTKQEYESAGQFEAFGIAHPRMCINDHHGLLIYDLIGAPDATEFRQCFLDPNFPTEHCCTAINTLYEVSVSQYLRTRPRPDVGTELRQDYANYVQRRGKRPIAKLANYVRKTDYGLSTEAKVVYDFLVTNYLGGKSGQRKVLTRLIHGDLHARNFMVSTKPQTKVELIDFAWGGQGHPLKDFALLEATIKYMLMPEYTLTHATSDKFYYISTEEYEQFEKSLLDKGLNLGTRDDSGRGRSAAQNSKIVALQRGWDCISVIRKHAAEYMKWYRPECEHGLGKSCFLTPEGEYYMSLYLISVGQFAFQTVEPIWILGGCRLIQEKLQQMKEV